MWEAVEYASVVGYPEAIEIAQSHADTTLERSLLVGETKNMVLMRMVRYDLPLYPIKMPADPVSLGPGPNLSNQSELPIHPSNIASYPNGHSTASQRWK
jgi:hypothetical protein